MSKQAYLGIGKAFIASLTVTALAATVSAWLVM